ncbi:MAG TPA: VWA domain-containing protein [Gemmatimonadales bacterium]|jgi:Ca-activated chloride channel family protein|nr:VWA domain-containing protein [Gemmatimonadales bacterium]
MIFDAPVLLFLAPVVALLAGLWLFLAHRKRVRLAHRWSAELAERTRRLGRWTPLLLALVLMFGLVALAGPRGGRARVSTETHALSLVLAIDISRSMLAEDASPNRLERALREARRLVQDSPGDRLGLIAFAGSSYILTPLTVDGGAVRMYLDALDPDLASEGGTSLSAVLTQGGQLLLASGEVGDRVLVVFTDGELHDSLGAAEQAAEELRAQHVRVVFVAEGGTTPVRIPIRDTTGTLIEYKLDQNGAPVETRREDAVLERLAEASDGTVVPADAPDQAGAVRGLLANFKRSPTTETRASDLIPRAWIPLLVAAVLLLLQTITRRGASLLVLALLLGSTLPLRAQRPSEGARAMAEGRPADAASRFLDAASGTIARDTAFYNAGTAALRAGRLDVARRALSQASQSIDPALRYRALYNLGLADLMDARADSANRAKLLGSAIQNLQQALLLEPGSGRAKWNLELAQRMKPPEPPPQSGGGGGGGGGGGQKPPPPAASTSAGMSQAQAEQILESMSREERQTREDQQRRMQSSASGVKDW